MKKNYFLTLLLTVCFSVLSFGQDLIITGVIDGPLPGGFPKGIELYAKNAIADLSIYGVESTTNGAAAAGVEYTFPADAISAGTFIYLANNGSTAGFVQYLGVTPQYEDGVASINGDDTVILYKNSVIEDSIGVIGEDGTGKDWDHLDGWAYRKDGKGPNATFDSSEWTFSGANALDGCDKDDDSGTNAECGSVFPVGTYSPTASTTPAVSIVGSVASLDYFENNGPSTEGSFTISGSNLTADITVTAPTNFEVSLSSGSGFASSVNVTQSNGEVSATTIYVRLAAGLSTNTYTGDITVASIGATDETLSVTGTVSPANPQINITAFVDPMTYVESQGGPSTEEDFNISGLFLTSDITITAPTNFEVSLTSGQDFSNSVTITPSSGTVATTEVIIRLASGLSVGNYSGQITISSTGVTDQTIDVTGQVFGAPTRNMIITGVYDGPLSSGTPKGVELYVLNDIADLSLYGLSSANNGGGSTAGNVEFTFPAVAASAGDYIYVSSEDTNFSAFFGFAPNYTDGSMGINGDDAIELYESGQIIDTFGDVNTDGSGEAWDYVDGWAYRNNNSQPGGTTFTISEWSFSGIDVFDGETSNGTATTPFPVGTFSGTLSLRNNTIEGFAVYPNPVTNSRLSIISNSTESKNVSIFNVLGKNVLNTTISGTRAEINTSGISAGIYILKVIEGNKTATSKLIVR